ncbi:zinc ABC transporter substrate-binding protein [Peptostreptococcaceae bacterium OttesenSCG-928-C18]|nr:zinc ABC transporter substrate-binding protein [Peptostreptococcaceae bacterium OttesenSCG-928-C18]
MKKLCGILIVFILVLTSCNSANSEDVKNDKPVIYTSIYPISYIAENIVGEKIEIRNIVPNDTDIHSWELTPKDIVKIEDTNLVLTNGLGIETWRESLVTTIGEDKLKEVNKGIDLINLVGETGHEEHEHGEFDPHIWMSVKNMKIMASNVYEEIIKLDNKNEEDYLENFNRLIKDLDELEKSYESRLADYKGRYIIVPHEAFSYLARDYSLNQVAIEGINSSSEPDLGKMAEIIDIAKKNNINTVFYEFEESDKIAKAIANEIEGKISPLYTLEVTTSEQVKNKEDYISLMYKNLDNLEKSFGE